MFRMTHWDAKDMDTYDPFKAPDPDEWEALDEGERIMLVEDYHVEAGEDAPEVYRHSMIHVDVENQVAMGAKIPVRANLLRLMRQGLDRHEALHAIGDVVAAHMYDLASGADLGRDPNKRLFKKIKKLNAADWLAGLE